MALTTISNGDNPDAVVLMANFNYLLGLISGGQAIKKDTMANLVTCAALNPTVAFDCIATDYSLYMVYVGDVLSGNAGFVTITSWVPGGIT